MWTVDLFEIVLILILFVNGEYRGSKWGVVMIILVFTPHTNLNIVQIHFHDHDIKCWLMWPLSFLEFSSHTIFEIEEWRTMKWEVMLDILVISTNVCFIFSVTATDNKKITIIPHLIWHGSPHTIYVTYGIICNVHHPNKLLFNLVVMEIIYFCCS